jgi:general secretion pathway protein G
MTDMNTTSFTKRFISLHGFTLLEIMIVMAIIGVLATIAVPSYLNQREKAKITVAISEIKLISEKLYDFFDVFGTFPPTLAAAGLDGGRDPWGNPYDWPISGDKNQKVRKDGKQHPINTDFDLCSKGKDGKTNYPLTSHASQDDIVRANNGGYIGLASGY